MKAIKPRRSDLDVPRQDLLTFLLDSSWTLAREDTKIQIDGANPSNYITKAEARDLVKRIGYVLRHRYGIGANGPGKDVVLIVSSGTPFLPILFYAIVAAGGVMSGASTALRTTEISRQVEDADTRLLICSPEYEKLTLETAERCKIATDGVVVLDSQIPKQWTLLTTDRVDVLKQARGKSMDWDRVNDLEKLQHTTICLLYSSGTTGLPKGVRLSQWAILSSCICTMDPARRYKSSNPDFVFDTIAHLPFANIAGIDMYCTNPIYMGGSTIWMKSYDFDTFVDYHRRYRPGYQYTVPPIWLRIAKSEQVTNQFDGLHVAVTGSAPIGYATAQDVRRKLGKGKAVFAQTWGTTETAGVICATEWADVAGDTLDGRWSVGDVCPNLRLRMLDENDQDIATGSNQPGEMLVGGDYVAQGYHNKSRESSETFIDRDSSPPHGWYRTGDIGVYKDGLVYIVDRKKELIKYKGQQVAPAELEALLTSHSEIADAAVIGVWHAELETEVPKAYVVRSPRSKISAEQVVEFVAENLAAHKRIRGGVVFVEQIPKSASGKILRKELREKTGEDARPKL